MRRFFIWLLVLIGLGTLGLRIQTVANWLTLINNPIIDARIYNAYPNTGLDQSANIQSAITASSGTGKCVLFQSGVYLFSSQVNGVSNSCLLGAGKEITFFQQSNNANLTSLIQYSSKSNVSVYKITFDGNQANNTTINNGLLNFTSSTNILVSDNEFKNGVGSGGSSGVCLAFSSTGNNHVLVEKNWVNTCGTFPSTYADGIYYGGSEARIVNNTFESIMDTPIVWESQSTTATDPDKNVVIADNTVKNSSNGIAISTLSGGGTTYLTGFSITGNTFYSTVFPTQVGNNSAINIEGGTLGRLYGGTVTGNTISGTLRSNGIILSKAYDVNVSVNTIYNVNTDSGNAFGIRLNTSSHLKVNNNTIDNFIGYGIYSLGAKDSDISNNTVINSINSSQPAGISFFNDTGAVTNDGITVNNNKIDNVTDGILMADASTNLSLKLNKITTVTNVINNATSGAYEIVLNTALNFAKLSTPQNGSLNSCSDCTIANPCAGLGTGALAKRLNGVWVCN